MIILGILWFTAVLYWDIISDYKKWKKHIPVDHSREGWIRILLLIPSTLLLSFPDITVWKFIASAILQGAVWLELFDGIYNKKRGFTWRYNGSDDPDDSWFDNIFQKLDDNTEGIIKLSFIGIALGFYLILQ